MPLLTTLDMDTVHEALIQWEGLKETDHSYKCILSDGDSWFSIGGATSSVLLELQRLNEREYEDKMLIINCAYPGDTLRSISKVFEDVYFSKLLHVDYGTKWDAILISAGGNDLIENLQQEKLYIDVDELKSYYRSFFSKLKNLGQNCKVLTHGYSMPKIRYRKLFWKLGPWIGPALDKIEPDRTIHHVLFYLLMKALHDGLKQLEREFPFFHALLPDYSYKSLTKWQNEIHPKAGEGGYRTVAKAFFNYLKVMI